MADVADDYTQAHNIVPQDGDEVEDKNTIVNDQGEGDVSGTSADLESDDNVRDNAREVGLYDNDEEAPEVDIASEIEKDEEGQRDIPPEKLPGDENED